MSSQLENFRALWDTLPVKIRNEIRAKARNEQMTLMMVIREWWPDLWEEINEPLII